MRRNIPLNVRFHVLHRLHISDDEPGRFGRFDMRTIALASNRFVNNLACISFSLDVRFLFALCGLLFRRCFPRIRFDVDELVRHRINLPHLFGLVLNIETDYIYQSTIIPSQTAPEACFRRAASTLINAARVPLD